jgi:hypothetical protein
VECVGPSTFRYSLPDESQPAGLRRETGRQSRACCWLRHSAIELYTLLPEGKGTESCPTGSDSLGKLGGHYRKKHNWKYSTCCFELKVGPCRDSGD